MAKIIENPIPTNIITGFLGTGKTTVIKHLLKVKPENERWAVLVNEFGEVGIDGALLEADNQQIFIREVPGGCMCCTSKMPMQIALAQLLAKSRPHRLLIEPTGLGHPKEVLEELTAEHNREIIDLRTTITLVDARKLADPRYLAHDIYREQITVAEHIVAAKTDLYQGDEKAQLTTALTTLEQTHKPLHFIANGELPLAILEPASQFPGATTEHDHHDHEHAHKHSHEQGHSHHHHEDEEASFQQDGVLRTQHHKDGFYTAGWIFKPCYVFIHTAILSFLSGLNLLRAKGVFITDQGIVAFNQADDVLSSFEMDESDDSRIELISEEPINVAEIEMALMKGLGNKQ